MYSIHDIVGLLVAVAGFVLTLVLPGIALGQITGIFLFQRLRGSWIYPLGLVVGYAFLPVVDSLLFRFLSIEAAIVFNLTLAAYGLRVVWRKEIPRPGWRSLAVCAVWFMLLAIAWIDIDLGDRLYPSLLMVDAVKHAATVRALLDAGGAPPLDPFFFRTDPAGYYYYYYVLSALTERLCNGLIDSRAAVGGQIFWTGLGIFALAVLLFRNAGFRQSKLNISLLLGLMALAGLQLVPIIGTGLRSGRWLGQIDWWSDEVTSFPMSVLWVPHHVASLIACWSGLLILANAIDCKRSDARSMTRAVVLAGIAFGSAAGLSIWVAMTGAICVALWIATCIVDRRWFAAIAIVSAGVLSAVILVPDLLDILHYRAYAGPPVTPTVREFPYTDNILEEGFIRYLARALMLPINYFIEFGALLIGSYLFWRQRELRGHGEVARLLTISAVAGLVLASFFKSTIIHNDLAWRAILFTQMSALLWTAAALGHYLNNWSFPIWSFPIWSRMELRQAMIATMLIGYAGVLYDLVALRAFRPVGLNGEVPHSPQVDREIRAAYGWLGANNPRHLVVQHNPNAIRAFAYGLYGTSLVAVSDRQNARLFGAMEKDVAQRLDELIPVFSTAMPAKEAWLRLAHNHVSAAIVTANDPIWSDENSWIWKGTPLYASARVRVVPVPGTSQ